MGLTGAHRPLVLGTVINAVGSGSYLPLSLIVLRGLSHLPLGLVGLALSVSQAVALVIMPAAGRLMDRVGPRGVLVAGLLLQAVGFVLYTVTTGFAVFLLTSIAIGIGNQVGKSARPVLIAGAAEGHERHRLIALNRSMANAGLGLGGLLLVVLPKASTPTYIGVSLFNASTFLIAALLTLGVAHTAERAVPDSSPGARHVLRDRLFRRYLVASVLSSVLYTALTTLIPLYAVYVLRLSSTLAGILFMVNTVLSAVAGVPVTRVLHRIGLGQATSAAIGISLMGAGVGVLPLCGLLPHPVTGMCVMLAMVVYTLGEVTHSPCASTLSLSAAPGGRRGEYQAAYQMTWTIGSAIAPATFTWLIEKFPLGGILLAVALATASASLLVERGTRTAATDCDELASVSG
jgi:MFS family permease